MDIILQVIRIFHPVGQGAFYTETLHKPDCNDDKHIVYDCGAIPYSHRLEEEIRNFLPKGSVIDILFISHFHADHVNGIKMLFQLYHIKHIVLPQIDSYEWFYVLENYLTTDNSDVALISNIRAFIGEANLIQVAPIEENDEGGISNESASLDGLGNILVNGLRPLIIDNNDFALWHFIVVNPLFKRDVEALKAEIQHIDYKKRKLTIDDLYNPEILVAVRKDLQTAYAKVFKGGNEYSMCMLSELADRAQYMTYSVYNENSYRCVNCWRIDGCRLYDIDGGLYCGDADFLLYDTLDCLKRRLGGRESHVGLLQLPHHGSKENFNVDLLNWLSHLQVSFACYGSPNRYNHPSSDVMGTAGCYSHVVGVDQCKSHILTERIDVVSI